MKQLALILLVVIPSAILCQQGFSNIYANDIFSKRFYNVINIEDKLVLVGTTNNIVPDFKQGIWLCKSDSQGVIINEYLQLDTNNFHLGAFNGTDLVKTIQGDIATIGGVFDGVQSPVLVV
ncbi:MAG: hypothetical protein IT269_02550, partial [Saprospiraceae bacterium]|nr:hypothetical protein [Saprospiraceae bacterium]